MKNSSNSSARSIATRTGDDGTTSLLYGKRVPKNHSMVEAVGTFDELNAALGMAKACCLLPQRRETIETIQKDLVGLMGELACPEEDLAKYFASKMARLGETNLKRVDSELAQLESKDLKFDGWATPGSNMYAAALDIARTTARRSERRMISLAQTGFPVRLVVLQYVNRVSDLLWLMAREAEQ